MNPGPRQRRWRRPRAWALYGRAAQRAGLRILSQPLSLILTLTPTLPPSQKGELSFAPTAAPVRASNAR